MDTALSPELLAIWLKSAPRQPVQRVESARTVARKGLVGNRHRGGRRQVTVLSLEAWREAEAELGETVDPALRKANLLVSGVDLEASRGRILQIGECRIALGGETEPCRLMDRAHPGLRAALEPCWRGGAYGIVLDDADIAVGDAVSWAEPVP